MKQFFYLSAFCVLALAACTGGFKKDGKGLEYKIISEGKGAKPNYGEYLHIHIKDVYSGTKDTLLQDTHELMPRIVLFDSVNIRLQYYNIFRQLKSGDSVVIRILTDSAYSNAPDKMPSYMKKGKYIYSHIKLLNIFKTLQQADSASKADRTAAMPKILKKQLADFNTQIQAIGKNLEPEKTQIEKDGKLIADYLAKHNIKAERTTWGTYVSVLNEGTGEKIDGNSIVSVKYTGRTLDTEKVFDSNIDPKFGHTDPLDVTMADLGRVILGWTDALLQLKKGAKAEIYIPSTLGYGKSGNGDIKADANLIFTIEVLDVMDPETFRAKQEKVQQEYQEKMKLYEKMREDSLKNAAGKK